MPTRHRLPVLPPAPPDDPRKQQRPRTRGDCVGGPRPCIFYSCRHHLGLEVNPDTGHLKVAFDPELLDQAHETCSLDVADRAARGHEVTLDEVGQLLGGVTRERVRQVEAQALRKITKRGILASYRA